jgi:hypothetical protein
MDFQKTKFQKATVLLFIWAIAGGAMGAAYQGFTLFGPNNGRYTYLINMNNAVVHQWYHSRSGGYSAYLLENGDVVRTAMASNPSLNGGGAQGVIQRYSWSGTLVWEYTYSGATYLAHHDIEPMPNGNFLLIAWEVKTAAQARQAGFSRNASMWPDHIIEVQPSGTNGGTIVWQWHVWDHLIQDYDPTKDNYGVVADHPELLDINVAGGGIGGDWMHINSISYNPDLDQIAITSHTFDEIYVIDHSTTTAEAAGHTGGNSGRGGDFLYRWGKPSNYDAPGSQYFNVVHCAWWIPSGLPGAGHLMAFNNREGQGTSQIVELNTPVDSLGHYAHTPGTAFAPTAPFWSYTASGFYSNHLGGCQRLPNHNTLIVESTSGYIFEVDSVGAVQWSYARGGEIARALRYGVDYPGVAALGIDESDIGLPDAMELLPNYPNPFNSSTTINFEMKTAEDISLDIYNILGEHVANLVSGNLSAGSHDVIWNSTNSKGETVNSGIYFCVLRGKQQEKTQKLILLK